MTFEAWLDTQARGRSPNTRPPPARLLHHVFERQALATPSEFAAEFIEKDERLTYQELNERASKLALYLHHSGTRPGGIVAILLPRGIEQYVAMLAILKAGGAYLPIDVDSPLERIRFILKDTKAQCVISCKAVASHRALQRSALVLLDDLSWNDDRGTVADEALRAVPGPDPTDLCYVIYTSGTSGHPKGVGISHANAMAYITAMMTVYGIRSDDRVLQGFSTAFDASVEEIWMAFSSGATLVVGSLETMRMVDELSARLRDFRITVFSTVPTLLRTMRYEDLPLLRLLLFGGEPAHYDLVEKWFRPGRQLFNGYGPTESTVVATYDWCQPGYPVTIGRPLPGYQVLVLNDRQEEVRGEEEGELCVGGAAVSLRGYINRPALNREKFFVRNATRFFRTGDLVRRNEDDKLLFCGRRDSQVKIRGYRIECEEVETQLSRLVDCDGVIVHAEAEDGGSPSQLIAYIVNRESVSMSSGAVMASLRERLPAYMIPSRFIWLTPENVPRLTSGKVDRAALPRLSESSRLITCKSGSPAIPEQAAFGTDVERTLQKMWQEVLKVSAGPDVSFFDCGGDSVRAAEFIARCRHTEELSALCIRDVYEYPTTRALAQCLQRRRQSSGAGSDPGRQCKTKEGRIPDEARQQITGDPRAGRVSGLQYLTCTVMQALVILCLITTAAYLTYSAAYYDLLHFRDWIGRLSLLEIAVGTLCIVPIVRPLVLCLAIVPAILVKTVVVGRFKEGDHLLWSLGYFRWWLANLALAPVRALAEDYTGTPLCCMLHRIVGATIGKNVFLGSALTEPDLITIDDGASIARGAKLRSHTIENGVLKLRRVHIGRNAFVGSQAIVAGGASMGRQSKLHHLSYLPPQTVTPDHSEWYGSPAVQLIHAHTALSRLLKRHEQESQKHDFWASWTSMARVQLLQGVFGYLYGLILTIPLAAQLLILFHLEAKYRALSSLNVRILVPATLILSATGFFGKLACIICAKWVLTGRARPGTIPLNSFEYVRRWFCVKLMDALVSPFGTRGVTETLLMPHVCRWLGMRVGRNTELSDVSGFQPDLLQLGNGSMLADRCVVGIPIVHCGRMTLGEISIGDRTFIANAAHVPITTRSVPDRCLIGVLSVAPDQMKPGTDWLGSPPMRLVNRTRSCAPDRYTFNPPGHLYVARAFFNLWKMVLPVALVEVVLVVTLKLIEAAHSGLTAASFLMAAPLILSGANAAVLALPMVFKWGLIGRYRSAEHPLWSHWMWRVEIVYEIELLVMSMYRWVLDGTPWLNWWYRCMGASIGARVCIYGGSLMEADLIRLDDDVSVEGFLETHLFEDRIMKLGRIELHRGCSTGDESCVLYSSRMGAYSALADLSLIMKREVFLPHRKYVGLPAQNAS